MKLKDVSGIKACTEKLFKEMFDVRQARSRGTSSQTQGAEFGKIRRIFAEVNCVVLC